MFWLTLYMFAARGKKRVKERKRKSCRKEPNMLIKRLLTCTGTQVVHRHPVVAQREKSLWLSRSEAEIYRWPLYLAVAACDRNSIKYSCNKQGKRKFIWNRLAPAAGSARRINLCPLDHLSLGKADSHRVGQSD